MEKIRIVCYGDSNTWGYISGTDHQRFDINERWPKVLANLLGDDYEVIEEGLNSRTLCSNDPRPGKVGKNGFDYLIPCIDTQDPIDYFILMLGTNELKTVYNKTPKEIGEMLEEYYVKNIIDRKSQISEKYIKLIIVAPPKVNEQAEFCKEIYTGSEVKSKELNKIYGEIASKYNCLFVDNEGLETGVDGVHMTKEGHNSLAHKIYELIKK